MISNLVKLTTRPTDGTSLGTNVHEDLSQCTDCKKWVKLELISALSASDGKYYLYFEVKNQWFEKITDVVISDGTANTTHGQDGPGRVGPVRGFLPGGDGCRLQPGPVVEY